MPGAVVVALPLKRRKKLRRLLTFLSLSESRKSWRVRWSERRWGNCRCFIAPSRSQPSSRKSFHRELKMITISFYSSSLIERELSVQGWQGENHWRAGPRIKPSARNSASRAPSERKRKIRLAFYGFTDFLLVQRFPVFSGISRAPLLVNRTENLLKSFSSGFAGKKAADEIDLRCPILSDSLISLFPLSRELKIRCRRLFASAAIRTSHHLGAFHFNFVIS